MPKTFKFKVDEGEYEVAELTRAQTLQLGLAAQKLPPEVRNSDTLALLKLEALLVVFCDVVQINDEGHKPPKTITDFETLPESVARGFAEGVLKANRDTFITMFDFLREARSANASNATSSASSQAE